MTSPRGELQGVEGDESAGIAVVDGDDDDNGAFVGELSPRLEARDAVGGDEMVVALLKKRRMSSSEDEEQQPSESCSRGSPSSTTISFGT